MIKILKILKRKNAAAVGVGAMIVFIAMVLVAGIAAAVLIQTANRLEIQAMQTGEQTKQEVATGLHVADIEGRVASSKITNMTITIRPRSGSGDIDLNHSVIEISNGTKKALLAYNSATSGWNFNASGAINTSGQIFATGGWNETNEEFGIIVMEDADGSCTRFSPIINRGDSVMLCINTHALFSNGCSARDDVWGTVIPEVGSTGVFSFRIPASLTSAIYDLY